MKKASKTKLLEDDLSFASKELKQYREIIEIQRKELEIYKKTLNRIATVKTAPEFYQIWADASLKAGRKESGV